MADRKTARANLRTLMADERRDLRGLIVQLSPDQWQQASLCAGWSVRDLVAHLIGWDDLLLYRSPREHVVAGLRFAWLYATCLGSMTRVNQRIQKRTRRVTPEALVARFAADDGVTCLPGVRWSAWRQLRSRRWNATDVEWSRGRGPIVEGSGTELLMALAGRPKP